MSVPALRFPEFSDKWCTKKLEEISEYISYGLTVRPEYVNEGIPLISAREIKNGVIDYENAPRISQESFDKLSNKAIAKKGDIFLSKTGTIGLVAYVSSDLTIAITQNIAIIRILDKAYFHPFILQSLKTSKFYKSAIDKVNQSTIMDLQLQDIRKLSIDLPVLPEQTKIANFLTAVDEKISHLTQKHDLLTQYKKGVMQQIFSQELRFKDDDGQDFPEWESKSIKELTEVVVGGTPSTTNPDFWQAGTVPWISSGELKNGIIKAPIKYITELALKKSSAKLMPKNTTVLAMTGATLGKVGYLEFETAGNQSVAGFLPNEKFCSKFLFYALLNDKNQVLSLAGGGAQQGINKGNIESLEFIFPIRAEQTKIADFLTAIDDKITATQAQLDAVKQYKQGLLQQMFV